MKNTETQLYVHEMITGVRQLHSDDAPFAGFVVIQELILDQTSGTG